MKTIRPLSIGEPAPWFSTPTGDRLETVSFDEMAGRYIVLFFFGRAAQPNVAEVLTAFGRRDDLFDHRRALFLAISDDPIRIQSHTGQIYLWDANGDAAKRYGVTEPVAFVVSPSLQVIKIVPFEEPTAFINQIVSLLGELLANPPSAATAPVLVVPNVFDCTFCRELVDLYKSAERHEYGFTIETEGKVIERIDNRFRKRFDWHINDEKVVQRIRELLERRLLPIVHRAFQFGTTRIERYLVGCYDAVAGGYFLPHRDNTAPIVAHRRFAVTINLNEGYEGGHLCFPEFGYQAYRTPPGDAIVFSCSLLHEAKAVTRDCRYAFLSFFYDERGQQIRDAQRNKHPGIL